MNKRKYFLIFTILLVVTVVGCITQRLKVKEYSHIEDKAPTWVDGKSSEYDENKYFIGVGVSNICCDMSQKLSASKDMARSEIAKIFNVKIESVSKEIIETNSIGMGKYATKEIQESYQTFVKSSVDMILEGVEIKDSFRGKEGEVYTLAILSKEKALNLFTNQISNEINTMKKEMNEAASAISKNNFLIAIKHNRRALLGAEKIQILNTQIIVAGGKAVSLGTEFLPSFIKIRIDRLFSRISIGIDGVKDNDKIASHILQTLTSLGFRIKKDDVNVDYLIRYIYDFHDNGSITMGDDYVSYKATSNLAIEILKLSEQKVVGKVNLEARGVGKSGELAANHSIEKLSQTIREELVEEIFKFL